LTGTGETSHCTDADSDRNDDDRHWYPKPIDPRLWSYDSANKGLFSSVKMKAELRYIANSVCLSGKLTPNFITGPPMQCIV